MKRTLSLFLSLLIIGAFTFNASSADNFLETVEQNQIINGFRADAIYESANGTAMGGRFVSEKYGFIVDLLQIQSVPQAFMWVKTPPTSSKGEPHACEHLLLGKGNKGRYVAGMEDIYLTSSTAYTGQLKTCYHFNTTAGEDAFYKIFEAKIQALCNPDFTDEEIRREVCHIGVVANPSDSSLTIDEKGTVYTEMISSFEKPWYYTYSAVDKMIYGANHTLTYNSGGHPDVMRDMTAEDMWKFQKNAYRLENMGAIISMPTDTDIPQFLMTMAEMLDHTQKEATPHEVVSSRYTDLEPAQPTTPGTMKLVSYPSNNLNDQAYVFISWPASLKLDPKEQFILDLFLDAFANGQTSNLYNLFINSKTRQVDLGGRYTYGAYDDYMDIAITFGLIGFDSKKIDETSLNNLRQMIINELKAVAGYPVGSDKLKEFNDRIKSNIIQAKKQYENNLNSPPMFGFRSGPAGNWDNLMEEVEQQPGFRKSLTFKDYFVYADELLERDENIWTDLIEKWQLISTPAYALGGLPDLSILPKKAEEKQARIDQYIVDFEKKYNTPDASFAVARYKEDFDKTTAELEALASNDKLPSFVENPPLSLDEQLKYETVPVSDKVDLVASTFENMSSSTIGLALDMNVVPESLLVYLPLLPDLLTSVGVVKNVEVIPYEDMTQRLQNEVLGFNAYYSTNGETGRVELLLSGQGSTPDEMSKALGWMDAALFSPYLAEDNLSRINDVIDQNLSSLRNRTKGSEESWVDDPAYAYRYQNNPLYLSTSSFLTETHHMMRLKWMFTDPGSETDHQQINSLIDDLAENGKEKSREELTRLLDEKRNEMTTMSEEAQATSGEVIDYLGAALNDIPDESLSSDFEYLCSQVKNDLGTTPAEALGGVEEILSRIRNADLARMYMISNSADREKLNDDLSQLVNKLDHQNAPQKQTYNNVNTIIERLQERAKTEGKPVYAGLLFDGTRNGVIHYTAKVAEPYDLSEEAMLNCLAGKLFGGYGAHGLFMQTWAAGLAYSNGFRYYERTGLARYYAERCPDVAETMKFVVGKLQDTELDPGLAEYAVAQIFRDSRAPSRYEQRGAAMAANITDNQAPDVVRAFRSKVLEIKEQPNLFDELLQHMESAYGSVLVGYGRPLSESKDGVFFLIGPEEQFLSMERLIETTEGPQKIERLYPRDFWLTK